jgi:hypothetical protein
MFPKQRRELALAATTHLERDVDEALIARLKEVRGSLDSASSHVLMRGETRRGFEASTEVERGHAGGTRDPLPSHLRVQVRMDECHRQAKALPRQCGSAPHRDQSPVYGIPRGLNHQFQRSIGSHFFASPFDRVKQRSLASMTKRTQFARRAFHL